MVDGLNSLSMLLPGVAVTYQGEEIGMKDGYVSWEDTVDVAACNQGNPDNYMDYSRDPARTPYHWDSSISAGFSTNATTWLPVAEDYMEINLQKQKEDDRSHYKALSENTFILVRYLVTFDTYALVFNVGTVTDTVDLAAMEVLKEPLSVVVGNCAKPGIIDLAGIDQRYGGLDQFNGLIEKAKKLGLSAAMASAQCAWLRRGVDGVVLNPDFRPQSCGLKLLRKLVAEAMSCSRGSNLETPVILVQSSLDQEEAANYYGDESIGANSTSSPEANRITSRYGSDMIDAINLLSLILPGAAIIQQGDELGAADAILEWASKEACWPNPGNPSAAPFPWDDSTNAGFTAGEPWLPLAPNYRYANAKTQFSNEGSHVGVVKIAAAMRKSPAIGPHAEIKRLGDALAVLRWGGAGSLLVVSNLGKGQTEVQLSRMPAAPTPEPYPETPEQTSPEPLVEEPRKNQKTNGERSLADELREAEEEELTGETREDIYLEFIKRGGGVKEAVERERLGKLALSVEEDSGSECEDSLSVAARRLDALLAESRGLHKELQDIQQDMQAKKKRFIKYVSNYEAIIVIINSYSAY
ncbi:hypothetical protein MSG28_001922 [Choristoneura fumiferana]|uniref:Uncharacterized protein n=1 Tax=Choristoneura fumiferana TaxID=7141 RepID=A0ACC0JT56_CHOFU|nr:hypothetical protein MSG28_001922 [Choristoneura fumiferana]